MAPPGPAHQLFSVSTTFVTLHLFLVLFGDCDVCRGIQHKPGPWWVVSIYRLKEGKNENNLCSFRRSKYPPCPELLFHGTKG